MVIFISLYGMKAEMDPSEQSLDEAETLGGLALTKLRADIVSARLPPGDRAEDLSLHAQARRAHPGRAAVVRDRLRRLPRALRLAR